jgi:hypothetical protein
MAVIRGKVEYTPGYYGKRRPHPVELTDRCIRTWGQEKWKKRRKLLPAICFSRVLGSGALEVADLLSRRLEGTLVADREVLEVMAYTGTYHEEVVDLFERRYPGMLKVYLSRLLDSGPHIRNEATERLFGIIISLAGLEKTIFVGRGAHLVLPGDRTLAVRFISSGAVRAERMAKLLHMDRKEAEEVLSREEESQKRFFQGAYHDAHALPSEFDLVINKDRFEKAEWAVRLVEQAFRDKFGKEAEG